MQTEDDIKKLLQENALQQTSQTFNDAVMKRITPSFVKEAKPLLNPFITNLLKGIFLISVLILGLYLPLSSNKNYFIGWIDVNNNFYNQIFSFLIAFWVVMFANILWRKRKANFVAH